jgi:triacylglycerol lipase
VLSSLAPARRRLVIALLAVLAAAAVTAVLLTVVGRDDPPAAVSQGTAGPVVLVPGYGGSTTGLDALAATLRRRGKDATVFRLPGNGRGDLDAQAVALARTVDAVLTRTKAATVDVVGYSAGGVVARLWVRDHGGVSKVRRVVTLGSPQHGTELATLAGSALPGACPTACQQLATGSDLLDGLNAGDETPAGPTWVSIWTTHDDVVLPPASASLAGALDLTVQSVCPDDDVRHSGLPTDPQVQALVVAFLRPGAPARPARCASVSS